MINKTNLRRISLLGISVLLLSAAFFSQCCSGQKKAEKKDLPAKVDNAVTEEKLSQVTLTAKAEERLGIEVIQARFIDIPGVLKVGGEIVAVPGNESTVSAPVAGTVLRADTGTFPLAGEWLKRGQPIMRLLPFPPEKDLVSAREDVAVKREQLGLAQSKADRAEKLLATRAISEKAFEESKVDLIQARAALSTAEARLNLLSSTDVAGAASDLTALVMKAPVDGVLMKLHVAQGQTVPSSAPLFEMAGLKTVWVKVPVYVGDLADVDRKKEAVISLLDRDLGSRTFQAKPVQGPPLSDAASASSSLFYEMQNRENILRLGQKVGVDLAKMTLENSLSLPLAAILYDMYGGTWVYVRISPHVYSRRRVEVSHSDGESAFIIRGLNAGDDVVTDGAAELYGTEFGVGK